MRVPQAMNKEAVATQTAQPQKATLTTPAGIQSSPSRGKFVPGQVGWSSNPNALKTMNCELL